MIAQLKASGLSGLGGAGFPTGVKWEAVRKERGLEKYVVCNADESEPGTIKDRFIMQQPAEPGDRRHDHRGPGDRRAKGHSLSSGTSIEAQEKILHEEIERCYAEGILGASVLGSGSHASIWSCSSAPADTSAAKRAR